MSLYRQFSIFLLAGLSLTANARDRDKDSRGDNREGRSERREAPREQRAERPREQPRQEEPRRESKRPERQAPVVHDAPRRESNRGNDARRNEARQNDNRRQEERRQNENRKQDSRRNDKRSEPTRQAPVIMPEPRNEAAQQQPDPVRQAPNRDQDRRTEQPTRQAPINPDRGGGDVRQNNNAGGGNGGGRNSGGGRNDGDGRSDGGGRNQVSAPSGNNTWNSTPVQGPGRDRDRDRGNDRGNDRNGGGGRDRDSDGGGGRQQGGDRNHGGGGGDRDRDGGRDRDRDRNGGRDRDRDRDHRDWSRWGEHRRERRDRHEHRRSDFRKHYDHNHHYRKHHGSRSRLNININYYNYYSSVDHYIYPSLDVVEYPPYVWFDSSVYVGVPRAEYYCDRYWYRPRSVYYRQPATSFYFFVDLGDYVQRGVPVYVRDQYVNARWTHADVFEATDWQGVAYARFAEGNYAASINAFTNALGLDRYNGPLYFGRAQAYFASGMVYEANADLMTGLRLVPDWPDVKMSLFELYDNPQDLDAQLSRLEGWVEANPGSPEGHFVLGYMYYFTQWYDAADDELRYALAIDPGNGPAERLLYAIDVRRQPVAP